VRRPPRLEFIQHRAVSNRSVDLPLGGIQVAPGQMPAAQEVAEIGRRQNDAFV